MGRYSPKFLSGFLFNLYHKSSLKQVKNIKAGYKHISEIPFLNGVNIKFIPYYIQFERIYNEKDYTSEDKRYLKDKFSIFNITRKSAFFILHKRNEANKHFLKLFTKQKNEFDIKEDYLNESFELFYNSYKLWKIKRQFLNLK